MGNRRQHIIELAAQVVYRQGFKGTSVENVLEIAGVGKGNFYHYFRSKDELGIAIIGEMEKWLNGQPGDDMFANTKSPTQRLNDYVTYVIEQRSQENHGDPLANLAAELGDTEPFVKPLRKALDALIDRFEAFVSEFALERGAQAEARTVARTLVGHIHGLSTMYKVDHDQQAFENGLKRTLSILQDQVNAPQPAPSQRESSYTSREQ